MTIWPLWICLETGDLTALIQFQRDNYGLELKLLPDIYAEIESLEEIDRLMRKPPEKLVKVK